MALRSDVWTHLLYVIGAYLEVVLLEGSSKKQASCESAHSQSCVRMLHLQHSTAQINIGPVFCLWDALNVVINQPLCM